MRTLLLLGLLVWPAQSLRAQAGPEQETAIRSILDFSQVENILAGRGAGFTPQVARLAEPISDEELARLHAAVTTSFEYSALLTDVVGVMAAEAPDGMVSTVLGWIEGGASAQIRALVEAYQPPMSLEDYTASLATARPPEERIELITRWAEVQSAGDFYILLFEALRESAYRVAGALREHDPVFQRLRGEELTRTLESSLAAAVVSFLYRYQTVPDELIERAIADYQTESGQWFVATYSLAVAEAIRAAGYRVVDELGGEPPTVRGRLPAGTEVTVRGRVLDAADSAAVAQAQVFFPALNVGSITNRQGEFAILKVPIGRQVLMVQATCYVSAEIAVNIEGLEPISPPIYLRRDTRLGLACW